MGKKKFIDKKKAVTFHLVHRSQHDPLFVDESAPQHVLVPQAGSSTNKSQNKQNDPQKKKVEQRKYGVFFDDDYDYLQHLRTAEPDKLEWLPVEMPPEKATAVEPKIKLPSSVFASEFEEDEGLSRRAAVPIGPRPDWDPDIVAALDDDFDFENPDNVLDDEFMKLATGANGVDDDDDEEEDDIGSDFSDENDDHLGELRERSFNGEENKSRFTEYSMSSSVIRRNAQLTLLDDRFEKFYQNYDETEIGALDCDEIEGHVEINDDLLLQYATEFKKNECETYDRNWDIVRIVKMQEHDKKDMDDEELVEMVVEDDNVKKWDCESILSHNTNIYNHPKLIDEPKMRKIRIDKRTGIPQDVLDTDHGKLTAKSLAKLQKNVKYLENSNSDDEEEDGKTFGAKSLCDQSVLSTLSILSIRPKNETKDEKHERKKLLKEYRAERRIEKKANTLAFKTEKETQERITANNKLNIQGKKLY